MDMGRGHMRFRLFILALFTFSPAMALASDAVGVVGASNCGDPASPEFVRAVRDALSRRVGRDVRSESETVGLLGSGPRTSIAGAKRLLSDAQSDIMSGEDLSRSEMLKKFQHAQDAVTRALEILSSLPPAPERSKVLLDVWAFELQQLYPNVARTKELDRFLESIFRVAPSFTFDSSVYSPPQIEHYESVRQRVRERATSTLNLTSSPPGMTFYMDGYEVGTAPLSLKVPPGTYRVQAASAGHHGIPHDVAVDGVVNLQVDESLERLVQNEFGPCLAASSTAGERATQLGQLGTLLGVQLLVGVRVDQTSDGVSYLAVESFDTSAGQRRGGAAIKLQGGKLPSGSLNGLWDLIGFKDASNPKIAPSEVSYLAPLPAQRPPPPGWLRPAAYVTGGLALGLAGLATYEGISAKNSHDKANSLLRPDGTVSDQAAFARYNSDGDSSSRTMYLSAGVAILFAGSAGVLGYLSREPGPPAVHF
jgi:hypothetical protein